MRLRRTIGTLAVGVFAFAIPVLQASPAQAFTGTHEARSSIRILSSRCGTRR